MHLHVPAFKKCVPECLCRHPGIDKHQCRSFSLQCMCKRICLFFEVIPDELHVDIEMFCNGNLYDRTLPCPAQEPGNLFGITNCCREPDALEVSGIDMNSFERNGKLCAALAASHLMDLIDDDKPDLGEMFSQPFSHEERLESFRSGDKQIRGRERLLAPLPHRCIPVPDPYCKPELVAPPFHAGEDIPVERAQGRDIQRLDPATGWHRYKRIKDRKHCALGFSGPGGRDEYNVLSGKHKRDCLHLRVGKRRKPPFFDACLHPWVHLVNRCRHFQANSKVRYMFRRRG